jgi:hypothetical protein
MDFVRTHIKRVQTWQSLSFKGQTDTYSIDYTPWTDDHGNLSSVVVALKSGTATIANESLTGQVKTFTVQTPETGNATITLTATAGNNVDVSYLHIQTKDPNTIIEDYGRCLR